MTDRLVDHPIVKAAGLRAGDSILEIGFRQVALMQTFAEIVGDQGQVTGVDIDPEHVAEAQAAIRENAWSNIQAMEGSILKLPFRDGTFDAVLSVGILHEVRDLDRAFREVSRVIRPDGRVVIADFKHFSRIKFALYRARIRLRGKPCLDIHPGFAHRSLATRLEANGLSQDSYRILPGEWTMGFIRSKSFLLVARKASLRLERMFPPCEVNKPVLERVSACFLMHCSH